MAKRLGSLVDEFKELVYPPDYNPEGKAPKRKQGKELGVDVQRVGFFFFFPPPPACYFYFILFYVLSSGLFLEVAFVVLSQRTVVPYRMS